MKKLIFLLLLAASVSFSSCEDSGNDRCAAITKDGTQCKRNAEDGSIYCWQHNR